MFADDTLLYIVCDDDDLELAVQQINDDLQQLFIKLSNII